MSAPGGSAPQSIPIDTLSVGELQELHKKVDAEVQGLTTSKVQLQGVLHAFNTSEAAIARLEKSQLGDELLLPLTGSLYVKGRVASVEKVIIDVGTGYFVERDMDKAVDYCRRKAVYLADNIKQVDDVSISRPLRPDLMSPVSQVLSKQQKAMGSIGRVLESKIAQEQQSTESTSAS